MTGKPNELNEPAQVPTMPMLLELEARMNAKIEAVQSEKLALDRLLGKNEICEVLNYSEESFRNKIPTLLEFGLFKEGRLWKMERKDVQRYIDSLKSVNHG